MNEATYNFVIYVQQRRCIIIVMHAMKLFINEKVWIFADEMLEHSIEKIKSLKLILF